MLKKDSKLRPFIIMLFFIAGLTLVMFGWRLIGKSSGLLAMFFGVILLLIALFVYNAPYFVKKE